MTQSYKIYTTVAPFDAKRQREALETWILAGHPICSINHFEEIQSIEVLKDHINYIGKQFTNVFGTRHLPIDMMLEEIANSEPHVAVIINSDLKLINENVLMNLIRRTDDQLIYCKKWNINQDGFVNIEKHGIDAFIFHSKNVGLIDYSSFCFGKPLWDFWLPWMFHLKGKNIESVETRFLDHHEHNQKWNGQDWLKLVSNYRKMPQLKNIPLKATSSFVKKSFARSIVKTWQ